MALMWSYNGYELPAIPDEVLTEYPYCCITLIQYSDQSYNYYLYAYETPLAVTKLSATDGTQVTYWTFNNTGENVKYRAFSFNGSGTAWRSLYSNTVTPTNSGSIIQGYDGTDVQPIWTNFDMYYEGSLFFAASDPTGPDIDMSGSSIAIHCHYHVKVGEMLGVTVSLTVPEGYDNSYTLEVQGAESENTRIEETDVENVHHLYIGADETSTMVLLRATSRQFPQLKATKGVQVVGEAKVTGIEIITTNDTIETGSLKNVMAKVYGENVSTSAFTTSLSGNNDPQSQVIDRDDTIYFSLFCAWEETADSLTLTVTSIQDPSVSASKTFTVIKSDTGGDDSGGTGGDGSGSTGGDGGGDSGGTGGGDSGDDSGSTGTDTADSYKSGYMAGLATGLALYSGNGGNGNMDLSTLSAAKQYTDSQLSKYFGGNGDQTIETVLSADEVCVGKYYKGVFEPTFKSAIAVKNFVKPFVVSAKLVSVDHQFSVDVYKDGVYVKTEGWLSNGTVYTFDHTAYQYKLYIGQVAGGYVYDFDACRKSIVLTISTADILEFYNALEIQSDTERRNTKNAVEYMMRRNYDISYANAPTPIGLTTHVGNNQIVHPKVLYFPNKFGGHKYWMAYTPYPFANDAYENPCVAYSSDGYNWMNIDGNPLDDPAGDGYNSDTHLVYVESTDTLELWYRYISNYETTPVSEIVYRQTTKDGINWTEKEIVINNDSGDYVQYLSPAVVHDGSIYKMWAVNSTDNTINYYESRAAIPGETIALDNAMSTGRVDQAGRLDENNTDYMYTEKIHLNATKSFELTGVNLNGVTVHPALRYVTAYDADGNVLSDHCLQNVAEATASNGRTITMDESVDSVIITIYKAFNYTGKTAKLPAVESDGELTKVRDIRLNYQDGEKVYKPWHIDVIEDNGKTVLLVMCKSGTDWPLFLSTSDDNVTFTTPELVMVGNPSGWDTRLYRSSIVNVDGEYRIYYSAQNEVQKYGLGVSISNTLSNFVGKW